MLSKIFKILKVRKIRKKLGITGKNISIFSDLIVSDSAKLILEDHIYIGPGGQVHCKGGVIIKNNVIIGPRVTIHSSNHNYDSEEMLPYDATTILKQVIIEENVWIGDSVMISPGVTIGEGAVIGMGAVVTKDIPALSICGGNPAKVLKRRDSYNYETLKQKNISYLEEKLKGSLLPSEMEPNK